jgi:hypothetical protein
MMRRFLKSVVMAFLAMVFVVTLNAQGDRPPAPASSPEKNTSAPTSTADSVPPSPASSEGLPDGFVLYRDQKSRFTIGIPSDWIAYDVPPFPDQQDPPRRIHFTLPPNAKDGLWARVLDIRYGVTPSFDLEASKAKDGMSCDGFSEKARAKVFKMAQDHAYFGEGAKILGSLRSEPILVAGCKGIRIYGSGTAPVEEEPSEKDITWSIEVRAVAGAKTLYLFILRASDENFKKNAEILKKSVTTFKLPAAK